jgi:acetyl esterase
MSVPCPDDRLNTTSMGQFAEENRALNKVRARGMWMHYLGEDHDPSATSPYAGAGPGDLARRAPAGIYPGQRPRTLRDEGILYAMRLMAEQIPVELYCAPGLHHGLVAAEDPTVEARANALRAAALTAALA